MKKGLSIEEYATLTDLLLRAVGSDIAAIHRGIDMLVTTHRRPTFLAIPEVAICGLPVRIIAEVSKVQIVHEEETRL